MTLRNKTILVTGGAGFIGSHIVERCLKEDPKKVIILDNFVAGSMKNIAHLKNNPKLRIENGSVSDFSTVEPLVKKSDFVFHEAASKMVISLGKPRTDLITNLVGTFNILEAAKGTNTRIIHASTGSVLGSLDEPMKEDAKKNPTSFYAINKLTAERYCSLYAKEFGIKVSVLRYFHVYGPRQDYAGEAGVVSIFLSKVIRSLPITVYSGGNQIRCFTFVTDVVDANMLLLENDESIGQVYNVASRERVTINELAQDIIKKYAKSPIKIIHGGSRYGENFKPIPDTSKIEELGFEAKVSFGEGLERTKKWVENDLRNKHH